MTTSPPPVGIPAFCVLSGGGAKAAAFPGCLAAAEDWHIDFQGYAGSSGGAIVAALAASGYTASELQDILGRDDLSAKLFADGGERLRSLSPLILDLLRVVGHGREAATVSWWKKPWASITALRSAAMALPKVRKLLAAFDNELGLYPAAPVGSFVEALIREHDYVKEYLAAADDPRLTFNALRKAAAGSGRNPKALKILATDLHNQIPSVLGEKSTGGFDIATAVAASAAYPFVFRPVSIGQTLAADAGLSANLPIHLFEEERLDYRWPVIAFDLRSQVDEWGAPSIFDLAYRLITTVLEASELPLKRVMKSVVHVRIPIPKDLSTLSFDALDETKQRELFALGKEETDTQLQKLAEEWRDLDSDRAVFHSLYSPPEAVKPVLRTIADEFERETNAQEVRCHVMLPTARNTRVIVYEHGVEGCSDHDITPELTQGVTGAAWRSRGYRLHDLNDLRKEKKVDDEVVPHDFVDMIPSDRQTMLAVPIFNPRRKDTTKGRLLGTLAVDSKTSRMGTGWTEEIEWGSEPMTAASRLAMWARVVAGLL